MFIMRVPYELFSAASQPSCSVPGYVTQYSTSQCETAFNLLTAATVGTQSLTAIFGQSGIANHLQWTATVTVNCGTTIAFQPVGSVLVTGASTPNFAIMLTSSAVCGNTPSPPAPSVCPFVCPDATCSRYLANCSCVANAALFNVSAQFVRAVTAFDVSNDFSALAFGTYRVLSGNCSGFDFNPNMRFSWVLNNASTSVVFAANGSGLLIPQLTLTPSATYTLNLTARGLIDSVVEVVSWTVTTVAPAPSVTITTNGAALRVSNDAPTTIAAFVTDPFPGSSPVFSWTCAQLSASTCPSLSNITIARLTIPAASVTGTFNVTFTYRGVSSSLNLTIVAGSIPPVRIIQTSVPVVASPVLYLPSQTVLLASSVSGYTNVTLQWLVNGVAGGNGSTLSVAASALIAATTTAQLSSTPAVVNTIVLRATAVADSEVFGEATFIAVVAPIFSLSLAVAKSGDSAATSAVGLTDTLQLSRGDEPHQPRPIQPCPTVCVSVYHRRSSPLKCRAGERDSLHCVDPNAVERPGDRYRGDDLYSEAAAWWCDSEYRDCDIPCGEAERDGCGCLADCARGIHH